MVLTLNSNHAPYYQVQSAWMASGMSKWYFVCYGLESPWKCVQCVNLDRDVAEVILKNCGSLYFDTPLPCSEASLRAPSS